MKRRIRSKRNSTQRRGLTLLELVVATLLGAMCLGALAGVIRLMETQRRQCRSIGSDRWRAGVVNLLERDLIGAHQIAFRDQTLHLLGFSWDNESSIHVPQHTMIALENLTGQKQEAWLTRSTRRLGEPRGSGRNLICGQVYAWKVDRVDDRGIAQPLSRELSPSPRRLRIEIGFRDATGKESREEWLFVAH